MGIALKCVEFGSAQALQFEEDFTVSAPKDTEVRIEVHAAGINYADQLLIAGKYQYKPTLPFVPGGEVAGIVTQIGKNCRRLQTGQHVYAACTIGGYASEVVVDESQVFALPSALNFQTGAVSVVSYGTAYHALVDQAKLSASNRILVLGATGSLGLAAVQVASALEAEVCAVVSSSSAQEFLMKQGVKKCVVPPKDVKEWPDFFKTLGPIHIVFDPLGGSYSLPAFRSLDFQGKYLVMGFVTGSIPKVPLNLVLLKEAQVLGVFWSRFRKYMPALNRKNFAILSTLFNSQSLRPCLLKSYSLSEYKTAFTHARKRGILGNVSFQLHM